MLTRRRWIEARANEALTKTGQAGPPTDLEAIADHFGITVSRAERDAEVVAHFDAARNEIVLGEFDRWPFAHELGHALLVHGSAECYFGGCASDTPLEEADVGVSIEAEANLFARHVLVPRSWVEDAKYRGGKVPDMARRFGVSQTVMWLALDGYKLV